MGCIWIMRMTKSWSTICKTVYLFLSLLSPFWFLFNFCCLVKEDKKMPAVFSKLDCSSQIKHFGSMEQQKNKRTSERMNEWASGIAYVRVSYVYFPTVLQQFIEDTSSTNFVRVCACVWITITKRNTIEKVKKKTHTHKRMMPFSSVETCSLFVWMVCSK